MGSAHVRVQALVGLGSGAPDAELTDDTGGTVFLSSFWAEEPLVLVLLPDLESEPSVDQVLALRDMHETFDEAGGGIAVVVRSAANEIAAFRSGHNVTFAVLSDVSGETHSAYSAPAGGVASFVIDTAGVVRYAHRSASALAAPATWDVIDAVCGLTGEAVERPEPPTFTPSPVSLHDDSAERPAFVTGAAVKAVDQVSYACTKCGNSAYEVVKLATSGGWLSRIFNFQYRNFVALVCTACHHADLYYTEGGAIANIADIVLGQ